MFQRTVRWLAIFLILLSIVFVSAPTSALAYTTGTTYMLGTPTFTDTWGVGLHGMANPVGLQVSMSAPSSLTQPGADGDGCLVYGCSIGEASEINYHIHVKGYCSWAGIRISRFENDPYNMQFQVQNLCDNGYTNRIRYTAAITDTTWRSKYVINSVSRPVFHDPTWTGQTGSYTDDIVITKMYRDTSNSSCVNTEIYNNSTSVWDRVDQNCSLYNLSGGTYYPDQSYFWYGMYYGGTTHWNSSGDLGSKAALYMSDMQSQATTGGSFAPIKSRNFTLDSHLRNHYDTSSATFYDTILDSNTGRFKFEWSAGGYLTGTSTGNSSADGQMALCFTPGTTFCDYSQNRMPNDKEWASYKAAPTMFGYDDTTLPYNLSIQRASPDNSIVTGVNQKLKSNRTYYFRANCWTTCSDVEVELNLGNTANYTVTGQGYVLRGGGGGTAPTCTWVVANVRYKCTPAAGSEVQQVYIKILTVNSAVNINALYATAFFNAAATNRQQDVYIGP